MSSQYIFNMARTNTREKKNFKKFAVHDRQLFVGLKTVSNCRNSCRCAQLWPVWKNLYIRELIRPVTYNKKYYFSEIKCLFTAKRRTSDNLPPISYNLILVCLRTIGLKGQPPTYDVNVLFEIIVLF